ncbi:MAG TPA: TonB-dependent receptor [Acidisarcina sp.]|nr:TonB-dependent receptor [Acidisarcina sp.]
MTIFTFKGVRLAMALLVTLVVVFSTDVQLFAQVTGATLSGTITDASGAALPNAQVVIENRNTETTRTTVSDKSGFYSAPNLRPGSYEVTVTSQGFATASRKGITLNVGGSQVIDVQMKVGQISEQVEVDELAPLLQLGSSELTSVVDSTAVRELPLNGRSWTDLATLQPGVTLLKTSSNPAHGADRGEHGFGTQLSIGGGKPVQNNYRMEGISVNDYANGAPGSVLGVSLGVDAIQEFSVVTSNYSAQYGRTSGGVINAITKSGTNTFHGSAYEFFRNSALDARNYFDYDANGNPYKAPFNRNQFGASAGGPLHKNKTFVFGDYESIRQSKGIATTAVVPSAEARKGNLTTGHVDVDPSAAAYLPLWHLPNTPSSGPSDTGIYSFTGQQILTENYFTVKVDHTFTTNDSMSGSYMFDNTPYSAPDGLNISLQGHHVRRQVITASESHLFSPAVLNAFHAGFNRVAALNNVGVAPISPLAKDTTLASTPGQFASRVNVGGLTSLPGGLGAVDHFTHGYNSYQAYDDVFWTRGNHSLKFGAAYENIRSNSTAYADAAGNWAFGSLEAFLTNKPDSFDSALGGATPRNIRQTIFGVYVQDTWRLHKNLTLDLGLRYEITTVPSEAHGKFVSLRNIADATPKIGGQLFANPTLHDFEPRLGFAWDPVGNSKTVVHGAFGMFDVLPLPYVVALLEVRPAPFYKVGTVSSGLDGTFFKGAYPMLGVNSLASTYIQQKPHRNYVMTWGLNIQREITPNLGVIVGYVGSRGLHQQFKVDDADMTLPTLTPAGYVFPYSADPTATLPTLNPNFGAIRSLWWNGSSSYHALDIGVTKRMGKGFQFQGSYTWSKSMDNNSTGSGADSYGNSLSSLHWYDLRLTKSVSDFNTPRVLSLSTTWDVPSPHINRLLGQKLLGGWELGGIFSAQDGQPFTVLVGGDAVGQNSSDPFSFPDRLSTPGCKSLVNPGHINNYIKTECFSMPTAPSASFYSQYCNPVLPFPTCINKLGNARRNILSGPALRNLDFSVYKNTPFRRISESFSTQVRVEFFNVLNHTNFQSPLDNNTLFAPGANADGSLAYPRQDGAGVIDQTTTDSREIQLAFKVIW